MRINIRILDKALERIVIIVTVFVLRESLFI